jgi:hypothetical protein
MPRRSVVTYPGGYALPYKAGTIATTILPAAITSSGFGHGPRRSLQAIEKMLDWQDIAFRPRCLVTDEGKQFDQASGRSRRCVQCRPRGGMREIAGSGKEFDWWTAADFW